MIEEVVQPEVRGATVIEKEATDTSVKLKINKEVNNIEPNIHDPIMRISGLDIAC